MIGRRDRFKDKQLQLLYTARGSTASWLKGGDMPEGLPELVLDMILHN